MPAMALWPPHLHADPRLCPAEREHVPRLPQHRRPAGGAPRRGHPGRGRCARDRGGVQEAPVPAAHLQVLRASPEQDPRVWGVVTSGPALQLWPQFHQLQVGCRGGGMPRVCGLADGLLPSPGRYHRLPLPEQGAPLESQFDAFVSVIRVSAGGGGSKGLEGGSVYRP